MQRMYLAVVGTAYLALGTWCSLASGQAAGAVGFSVEPGSGQSEFLVVYGGLELGLGLIFLRPLWRRLEAAYAIRACAIIHGSLVLFRTASFFLYAGISTTTYGLAAVEWAVFLSAGALWIRMAVTTSSQR